MDDYSYESHIQHMFDSYCKILLRNEAKDIQKQYSRFRKKQVSISSLNEGALDELYYYDESLDNHDLIVLQGLEFLIKDKRLSDALGKLEEDKQQIISYCTISQATMIQK